MVCDRLEEGVGLGCGSHQDALTKLEGRARVLGVAVACSRYLLSMGAIKSDVADALAGEAEEEITFRHVYLDLVVFDLAGFFGRLLGLVCRLCEGSAQRPDAL